MRKVLLFALLMSLMAFTATALAAPPSGHTTSGPWEFDWVAGAQGEGLALQHVRYNGEVVLWKASLPVVRVQYEENACGPYADKLSDYALQPISWCGNNTVCQRTFSSAGRQWLEMGTLYQIGSYELYQVWYLSDDGYIHPRLFSRGLQCNVDHNHHVYWRMDFDIDGFADDQIFVFDNNRPNIGWGPGWQKYDTEFDTVKNPSTDRLWFVRDDPTGDGSWAIPGADDGVADNFSDKDAAGRRFHFSEDQGWTFGAWGKLGYNDGEDIAEQDDVYWYIAHLPHEADEGPDVWFSVGPWFKVHR